MSEPRPPLPPALAVAAVVVALEGVTLGVLAVLQSANMTSGRVTMGVTTTVFFLGLGAVLLVVAWGLFRTATWSRGPAVMLQLLQLGVAWSFRGTPQVALVLVGLSAVVLLGVLSPSSTAVLVGAPADRDEA